MIKKTEIENDELVVPFKGGKLNKDQANKTGVAIIFGIIGILISLAFFGKDHRFYSFILGGIFAAVGFFGFNFYKK